MAAKPTLFSAVQPTGLGVMLGNYLGAIRQWAHLQEKFDCLFCVADLHAITVKQEPQRLREMSRANLAMYIACGLDPQQNVLFLQSTVPEHTELAWILACSTYMGELSRMTQFKDKSLKGQNIGTGLFVYPALMAADILLYQAKLVPVGEDQKQHLELTRDLALRFNNAYGPLFTVPDVYIPPLGARIMSLQNPAVKMSKSDEDAAATVYLVDSDDVIAKKIRRAVTDSIGIVQLAEDQPGVRNLLTIQSVITGETLDQAVARYSGKQYGALKAETADIVISCLKPVRERFESLMKDPGYLKRVFDEGAHAARPRAHATLAKVKEALGFAI